MTRQSKVTVRDSTTLTVRTVKKRPYLPDIPYRREPFPSEELDTEEWLPVVGHESRYEISSLGRIRSVAKAVKMGRKMKPGVLSTRRKADGYEYLNTSYVDGGGRWGVSLRIHRAVAMAFIPNPDNLPIVHH